MVKSYELKVAKDGKVEFLMRTGKDYVMSHMALASAQHILDTGKVSYGIRKDYPISVDDLYFFAGKEVAPKTAPKGKAKA